MLAGELSLRWRGTFFVPNSSRNLHNAPVSVFQGSGLRRRAALVQVTWLRDAGDLQRKKSRNTSAKFFKGAFGR
jgi:hypothetical protein